MESLVELGPDASSESRDVLTGKHFKMVRSVFRMSDWFFYFFRWADKAYKKAN